MAVVTNLIYNVFSKIGNLSFSSANLFFNFVWAILKNFFSWLWNLILSMLWTIINFVLGVMELFEYMINEFLGIGKSVDDIVSAVDSSTVSYLVKVFRAVFIVGVLLVVIFTIIAIIRQEWNNAVSGYVGGDGKTLAGNDKTKIVLRMFKNIAVMLFIPLIMVFVLSGVNAVLTSFSNALKGNTNSSVAAKVLASSSYDANKYRRYAEENKRIPVTIETYNPDDYDIDEKQKYIDKIKSRPVQTELLDIAMRMDNGNLPSFADTLLVESGSGSVKSRVSGSEEYANIYESFICTPEQYQVMADFIDYAQEANLNYYIKAMDENDIDWQYVEDAVYDKNNNTLTINYTDATDLNQNGNSKDAYQIVYSMSYNVTTPISDALKTLSALLGIDEYGDNLYNVMERDEDYTNYVDWSNEKVLLKLSENFDITNSDTWTSTDEIIMYEYHRFSSRNNTLNEYTLDDLIKGVELDAREMHYVEMDSSTGLYMQEVTEPCVYINKRYYRVEKSETERDSFGTLYYVLSGYNDVNFFKSGYKTITKTNNNATLMLSNGFNINDRSTWTYSDQLLVYEYYKDLSYNNAFNRAVGAFTNLRGNGLLFPIYQITNVDDSGGSQGNYVLLNDTFYQLVGSSLASPSEKFLADISDKLYYQFQFDIEIVDDGSGISNMDSLVSDGKQPGVALPDDNQYADFQLKFSKNFEYQTPSTWSYRDYFIFYLYLKYLTYTCDLDSLKTVGLVGEIVINNTEDIYLNFKYKDESGNNSDANLDVKAVSRISQLNMYYNLDAENTILNNNIDFGGEDLYLSGGSELAYKTNCTMFYFSDGFEEYDMTTWTVLDMILYNLSSLGAIEPLDVIMAEGYGSKVVTDGINSYYRFGGVDNEYTLYFKDSSGVKGYSDDVTSSTIGIFNMTLDNFIYFKTGEALSELVIDANSASSFEKRGDNIYSYTSGEISDFMNWTLLDLIFKYLEGVPESLTETSKLYTNGSSYFLLGSDYINIQSLGGNFGSNGQVSGGNKLFTFGGSNYVTKGGSYTDSNGGTLTNPIDFVMFSDGFDPSDFESWTLADFILYYEFTKGTTGASNFQSLVAENMVSVNGHKYYLVEDAESGFARNYEIITFGDDPNSRSFINYNAFKRLYKLRLRDVALLPSGNVIKKTVEFKGSNADEAISEAESTNKFLYAYEDVINAYDFIYDNFYYYKLDSDKYSELGLNVPETVVSALQTHPSDMEYVGRVDLKLTAAINGEEDPRADVFEVWRNKKIDNVQTWTIAEWIAIFEFSYSLDNKNNIYNGLTFRDICEQENYMPVYKYSGRYYLEINSRYYDLTDYISEEDKSSEEGPQDGVFELISSDLKLKDSVSYFDLKSGDFEYNFKILFESENLRINPSTVESLRVSANTDSNTIAINVGEGVNRYYTVDTRVIDAFILNTNYYANYTQNLIIREVNWPQKLMNDMFVIYPDLNWETLIATDGWLDGLGDFTSAFSSGDFIEHDNSANITAAGLVLSEFFLSVSKRVTESYALYEYSPVFDEDTVKALMLSMLGEDNYYQLVEQANIFTELFNIAFAPILDKIAAKNSITLGDGKVDNLIISAYKAYLSTVLMSSDYGEYLYRLATRVYAQYTIYEAMASASGNYAGYLAYLDGETDENGEPVSFKYSTFYELVKYENTVFKANAPTFTFNYRNVYQYFIDADATDDEIRSHMGDEEKYKALLNQLINEYEEIYNHGQTVKDDSDIYCFMLDVYFSAAYQVQVLQRQDLPEYMELYMDYITAEIPRWDTTINDVNINGASQYIPDIGLYKALRELYKALFSTNLITFYFSFSMDMADENGDVTIESVGDTIKSYFTFDGSHFAMTYGIIADVFNRDSVNQDLKDMCDAWGFDYTLSCDPRAAGIDLLGKLKPIIDILGDLPNLQNNETNWSGFMKNYSNLGEILSVFSDVVSLETGDIVSDGHGGTIQKVNKYTDLQYEVALSRLESLYNSMGQIIDAQNIIDKATKASISFMLAQYAENYKTEGFSFDFENVSYNLGSTINPMRLAEYVYGGAWLEKFGVQAVYTNSDFEGLIKTGKKYDSTDHVVKTEIITGDKLKKFVTKLADYTADLYYLTNFNDLSNNVGDYVKLYDVLTDYSRGSSTTIEKIILEYMIQNETINIDTWVRLIVGDTEVTGFSANPANLITYLASEQGIPDDFPKQQALLQYIDEVFNGRSSYYTGAGNMKIHSMFKNAMSYILLSDQSSEEEVESVNLDDLNFKDFRKLVIRQLVNYLQNESETPQDNSNRYISLFHLVSGEVNYYIDGSNFVGRTINYTNLEYEGSEVQYKVNYWDTTSKQLRASYSVDKQSQNKVLELAGVANRPIETLVNLEYDHLYDMNGNYDEANGDTFILCTYNELSGLYTPILMRSSSYDIDNEEYSRYTADTGIVLTTDYYYKNSVFPIIAKGILTYNYRPTAIRMVDGVVQFYRTDITATTSVNEGAMTAMQNISEVSTVNYTSFVRSTTAFKMGASAETQAMFIGKNNVSTFYNSDLSVYYLQLDNTYVINQGELGAINILDNFSAFYIMRVQDYILLILGMATILPIMFKASLAVIQRIFDLLVLTLIGPWPVSMNSLIYQDDQARKGSKSYQMWKRMVTQAILSAFGYIVAFNVYFILIKTIMGMTFVSEFTIQKIQNIGGMSFITFKLVNTVIKYMFILLASGSIKATSSIVTNIITTGKVDDAFTSPISGDIMDNIKKAAGDVMKAAKFASGIITGTAIMNAASAALEAAKQSLPGAALITKGVEKGKQLNNWRKSKQMEKDLEVAGLPPHVAKAAAKRMKDAKNNQMNIKNKNNLNRANEFQDLVGGNKFTDIYSPAPKKKKSKDKKKKKKK